MAVKKQSMVLTFGLALCTQTFAENYQNFEPRGEPARARALEIISKVIKASHQDRKIQSWAKPMKRKMSGMRLYDQYFSGTLECSSDTYAAARSGIGWDLQSGRLVIPFTTGKGAKLCPLFFTLSLDSQAIALMHEASHLIWPSKTECEADLVAFSIGKVAGLDLDDLNDLQSYLPRGICKEEAAELERVSKGNISDTKHDTPIDEELVARPTNHPQVENSNTNELSADKNLSIEDLVKIHGDTDECLIASIKLDYPRPLCQTASQKQALYWPNGKLARVGGTWYRSDGVYGFNRLDKWW